MPDQDNSYVSAHTLCDVAAGSVHASHGFGILCFGQSFDTSCTGLTMRSDLQRSFVQYLQSFMSTSEELRISYRRAGAGSAQADSWDSPRKLIQSSDCSPAMHQVDPAWVASSCTTLFRRRSCYAHSVLVMPSMLLCNMTLTSEVGVLPSWQIEICENEKKTD